MSTDQLTSGDGAVSAELGDSGVGLIWTQLVALAGNMKILTLLDLLKLTSCVEAISRRNPE